tara:strand:+ start:2650 stop:2877 length:228 start_codon:yes stop_codon:yes gene_type:complete
MIKDTKITLSTEDSKIIIRMLDMAHREMGLNKEDRSTSFRWLDDKDIERYSDVGYLFSASDVTKIIVNATRKDDK